MLILLKTDKGIIEGYDFSGGFGERGRLSGKKAGKVSTNPREADYWMYEGETLAERRSRMESGIEYSDKEVEAAGDAWMQQQADIERGK